MTSVKAAPFGMQSARRVSNILIGTRDQIHTRRSSFTDRTGSMPRPVTGVTLFAHDKDAGLTSSFAEGPP